MKNQYCSDCLKPCRIGLRDDSFSHEFGIMEVFWQVSACCGETVVTRREAVQEKWERRQLRHKRNGNVHPVLRDFINGLIRRAA